MAFTIRQLQFFIAVAEQGTVSGTAQNLSISQRDAAWRPEADMSLYALEDYTAVRHVMVAHG